MENQSDTTNLRAPGGILLRLFILKLSVCIATSHLGSLRHMPRPHHIWFVIATVIYPLTPAVDFVFNFIRTFWNVKVYRQRLGEWQYILDSIAGVYSNESPGATRLQLSCVQSSRLRNAGGDESYLKIGRVIVVLAFVAQVVATLFLLIRRINIVGIHGFHPDEHALYCAISGLAVAFQSLMIQCTKQEWVTLVTFSTETTLQSRANNIITQHVPSNTGIDTYRLGDTPFPLCPGCLASTTVVSLMFDMRKGRGCR